jgi:hypothetical protein
LYYILSYREGVLLQPSGERVASQNYGEEYELTYLIAELFLTFSLYARIPLTYRSKCPLLFMDEVFSTNNVSYCGSCMKYTMYILFSAARRGIT